MSRLICGFLLVVWVVIGCAATPAVPPRPALINHVVFFKLKSPTTAEQLIADCDEHLAMIPGIVSYYSGKHFDVGRETVESDYDVGLYLGFMSQDEYEDYLEHPTHIRMESKWQPRLQWMRVHDTIDRTR